MPLVFVHVPKTGGTSLQRDLNVSIPDGIHIPPSEKERHWENVLKLFTPGDLNTRPQLVRGHLNYQHLSDLARLGVASRPFSYLRHPAERLISQFLWRRANHRKAPETYKNPESFRVFCDCTVRNLICDWLIGPVDSAEEAIDLIKRKYWFIGLTEFYHVCQSVLFASLGVEYRIRQRRNQTVPHAADRAEIDYTYLEKVSAKMSIDLAVYEYFQTRWLTRINEAVELLMTKRPSTRLPRLGAA